MDAARKLLKQFNDLADAKGWTVEELHELLTHGAMYHCQPCLSSVAKWRSGDRVPSGAHLLALLNFVQTHDKNGIRRNVSANNSVKPKTKRTSSS